MSEIIALRARVAELELALEPLAKEAEGYVWHVPEPDKTVLVPFGLLAHARAALRKTGERG